MTVEDCYQLGYVIKTHGLKGEVQILLDVDDPSEYTEMESMLVYQNNSLVPFFIEHIQINGKKALVQFEDFETIEQATELVSSALYLPLKSLPTLNDGQYYLHQLVGMKLFDQTNLLGTVDQIFEIGPQELISVIHQGKEVLVPLTEGIINKVDLDKQEVHATLPDGLLNIYMEDDEN